MGGGEGEPSVYPCCVEGRKRQISCSIEIRRAYEMFIVGNVAGTTWGGIMDVEVPEDQR